MPVKKDLIIYENCAEYDRVSEKTQRWISFISL